MTVPACLGFGGALGVNGAALLMHGVVCFGWWKEENGTMEGFSW